MKIAKNYSTSSSQCEMLGDVMAANVCGTVTTQAFVDLLWEARVLIRSRWAYGVLIALPGASLAVDGQAVIRTLARIAAANGDDARPAAFHVRAQDRPLFDAVCRNVARHGVVASVFTDPRAALEFAQEQGELWAAQRVYRVRKALQSRAGTTHTQPAAAAHPG